MPTLAPLLNSPVAIARSLLGCHRPTVLIAPGKLPPSAKPRVKRTDAEPGHRHDRRRQAAQEGSGEHGLEPRQPGIDQRADQAVRHGHALHTPNGHEKTLALADPVHHPSRRRIADGVGQGEGADDETEIAFPSNGIPRSASARECRRPGDPRRSTSWRRTADRRSTQR